MSEELMRRYCFLFAISLMAYIPCFAQSFQSDSQTLQALLAEVRQLRHELQASNAAAQKAQILVYRLQLQEVTVARGTQKVETADSKFAEVQKNRTRMADEVKRVEEFISQSENSTADRKQLEASLQQLKASLEQLETEEQQQQTRAVEAKEHLNAERTKLTELQAQLERLEKFLDRFN
jgi:DNA repair exonuclease SbcCD ATPase subunit